MVKKRNFENDEAYKNFRLEDYLPSIDRPKRKEVPSVPKEEQPAEVASLFPVPDEPNTSAVMAAVSETLPTDEKDVWEDVDNNEKFATTAIKTDVSPERAIIRRISGKQRRLSLEEYRSTYLQVPKIADRKPVFVSREVRDRLDEIVRRLGGRGMSVSGLVENITRQHFATYANDIDQWRKL
jgi:hypothetical protein